MDKGAVHGPLAKTLGETSAPLSVLAAHCGPEGKSSPRRCAIPPAQEAPLQAQSWAESPVGIFPGSYSLLQFYVLILSPS